MKDVNGNPVDDPEVVIPVPPEITPPPTEDDGGIEVVVGEEITPVAPAPTPPPAARPAPELDVASLRNKVFAQDRILNSMRRQIEDAATQISTAAKTIQEMRQEREGLLLRPSSIASGQEDDVEKLVKEGNWRKGVDLLITRRVAELTDAQRKEQQQQIAVEKQQQEVSTAMQVNIQSVIQRHPELDDNTSEKWSIYDSVLAENPRWRQMPDGPLLAMYVMEERMRTGGKPTVTVRPGTPVIIPNNPSLPPARSVPPSNNRVHLTQEQKQFCDDNNIPYEDYAKSLTAIGRGEGKVGISV